MGWRDKLAGLISPNHKWTALTEAWSPMRGQGADIDPEGWKWRRMSQHVDRTLPSFTQERSIEIAYYLWRSNPLARRIIELQVDHIVGDGIRVRAKDPTVQAWLDDFCNDPVTAFHRKFPDRVRYLSVFGEQILPTYVHEASGKVRLGYIDPAAVESIRLDDQNAEIVRDIVVRNPGGSGEPTVLPVVNWNDETGYREGKAVYWAINRPPNSTRGASDLLSQVDWLDALDQYLIGTVDRILLQNLTFVDLEVQGADEKTLKDMQKAYSHLKPGTVRARNEKMKAQFLSPEIDGRDIADVGRILTNWCGVRAGYPPHWLGQPGETNRATADAEGVPALKSLRSRQRVIRSMIGDLFDYVIDQAQKAGTIAPDVDRSFDVVMHPITSVDTARIADAVSKLTNALSMGQEEGWVTDEETATVFRHTIGLLGIDLEDVDEATGTRDTPARRQQAAAAAALDEDAA